MSRASSKQNSNMDLMHYATNEEQRDSFKDSRRHYLSCISKVIFTIIRSDVNYMISYPLVVLEPLPLLQILLRRILVFCLEVLLGFAVSLELLGLRSLFYLVSTLYS